MYPVVRGPCGEDMRPKLCDKVPAGARPIALIKGINGCLCEE